MIRPSILTGGMRRGRGRGQAVAEAAGSFSDGHDLFGLEGNEAFDPDNPTLKDGTSITGQMADDLAGYVYWRENQATAETKTRFATIMAGADAYNVARNGQLVHDTVSRVFRLTGDLRDLDFLCAGYDALQATLDTGEGGGPQVSWEGTCSVGGLIESCCGGGAGDPWSPYRKLTGARSGAGTDLNRLNQLKLWAIVAEFAWMLHINQAKTSPGGVNYGTRLTYWKARLEEHVRAWSETTSDCWAVNNYKGVDGSAGSGIPNVGSSRFRQTWGKYPYAMRDEGHTGLNTIMLHRYIGLLGVHASLDILNPADALTCATDMVTAARNNGSYKACSNTDHGDSLPNTHNNPFGGNSTAPQRMTYIGYQGATLLQMWLTGAYRDVWTLADMLKVGSALAWGHDGTSGLTHGNLTRGAAECGFDAVADSGRSAADNSIRGMAALPIVFDPGGSKMASIASNLVSLSGGVTPDRAVIHSARFAHAALEGAGDFE